MSFFLKHKIPSIAPDLIARSHTFDAVVLGAGAAGMMCAAHAGQTGKRILVLDHARSPGEKIRISGGGRCNFTNLHTSPSNFLSENRHFAKSALSRYTQHNFIDLVQKHRVSFHEKAKGQLFCDESAKDIIQLLINEMEAVDAELWLSTRVKEVTHSDQGFQLSLEREGATCLIRCHSLVVACGGKSIPKMGASGFGYSLAQQFGHAQTQTRPGLVPLTFAKQVLSHTRALSGVSASIEISCEKTVFAEDLLFTHRGLSGPAILQISSYWREGDTLTVDFLPGLDLLTTLKNERQQNGSRHLSSSLSKFLPNRLLTLLVVPERHGQRLADLPNRILEETVDSIRNWSITPVGSEGYRTAEVTLGGVATHQISSQTMESKIVPGLYFIGEVLDVTGWLGGYNFQWAWSSGFAAGSAISAR